MDMLAKLYLLSLLDALCFGLIIPTLPPYILSLHGTHFILGSLFVAHNGLQQLSSPLIRSLTVCRGKKYALVLSLWVSLFSHLGLNFASTPWLVVLVRIWFSLTNQTQTLCKHFVSEVVPKEQQDGVNSVMGVFGIVGFVIGPIVSGHLFDMNNDVLYISLLASFMVVVSLMLARSLSDDRPKKQQSSLMGTFSTALKEDLASFTSNVQAVNYRTNWDIISIRFLYCSCVTIFFTKFVVLLKTKFQSSCTIIGYICAYQGILLFGANFLVPFVKARFYKGDESCSSKLLQGLVVLLVSLIGLCFAGTYDVYLLSIIPLAFSRTLLDSTWHELFKYNSDKENDLTKVLSSSITVTSLTVPFIFGGICDIYGQLAVKAFTIVPTICAIILAIRYEPKVTVAVGDAKTKSN